MNKNSLLFLALTLTGCSIPNNVLLPKAEVMFCNLGNTTLIQTDTPLRSHKLTNNKLDLYYVDGSTGVHIMAPGEVCYFRAVAPEVIYGKFDRTGYLYSRRNPSV